MPENGSVPPRAGVSKVGYNLSFFRIALFRVVLLHGAGSAQWYAQLHKALQIPPPGWSPFLPLLSTDPTLVFVLHWVFWAACICGLLGLYAFLPFLLDVRTS